MRSQKLISIGVAAALAGISLLVVSVTGMDLPAASAGNGCPTTTPPSATPDPVPDAVASLISFGETEECPPTQTEGPAKTHTPTNTATPAATETAVPATEAPSATPVPATNTPTGGAGAGGVQPPNTGYGSSETAAPLWMLSLAAILAVGGAAAIVAGARRS
jgi:hypothetical protein